MEKWGISSKYERFGGGGRHIFTHLEWHMTARVIEAADDALPQGWVWAGREELHSTYAVPNAFQSFAHLVEEYVR